ncbi:MAG: sensor histidine kinase [Candidatus Villigracilaceae bacterium]
MPKSDIAFPDKLDLTHFISAEAHDLRSPFNRILGFTKVVLKGMDGPLTDLQKEDLTTVYVNSTQALNMMNNLIDVARLALKQKQPSWKEINIQELVGQAISHWQQLHPAQQIQIHAQLPNHSISLQGDENLLRLLLAHGMTCVYLYVKEPHVITLEASTDSKSVRFSIYCAGEPLGEAQNSERTIVAHLFRTILELHNGKILQGESDENGAIVRFELPLTA